MASTKVHEVWNGYYIEVIGLHTRSVYVWKSYKGDYMFTVDYSRPQRFKDRKTVRKHVKALEQMEER